MQKEVNKNVLGQLGIFYGIIISIINYIGYLITSTGEMPMPNTEALAVWIKYMNEHAELINIFMAISFIIPVLFCIFYVSLCKTENLKRRIINLPLAYSLIGSTGWLLSFLMQTGFLFYLKYTINLDIKTISLSSFFNIAQSCLLITTLTFLCLDAIHRKFILPRYFSDGNLNKYKGTIKLSSKFLFAIFYISVSTVPVFFLSSTLYNLSLHYDFNISLSFYIVLALIIFFGVIILITFSNYFSAPIKKLRDATKAIRSGNYTKKIDVVSNDDLGELADNFNDMALSLDSKTKKILAIQDSVIRGMAVMVESRDNSTGGHINRTSDCVRIFVNNLRKNPLYSELTDSFCSSVIKAAPMHDLGKIAVDDSILRKPGKFTDEEYEKMKMHSAEGARIVKNVLREVDDSEFKKIAVNVAHFHHEKWNGSGYPEKLSGTAIPLEARIMALADVFDALVSKRCYKDSMTYDQAFNIIQDSLGSHFDPDLGKEFINCRKELEELYNNY